jgi:glutaredoxin
MPEANGSSQQKELVIYTRTTYCPYQARASRVFEQHDLHPREILIDMDQTAMDRVIHWTGFKSVPTIIAAPPGGDMPIEEPAPLARGASPRGVDRGSMITEATEDELIAWLRKHGFIE